VIEDPRDFPSLASILGDDEQLSNDEDEPPLDHQSPSLSKTEIKGKQLNSFLQIDLSQPKNYCEDVLSRPFNETLGILDQSVSIFARFLFNPEPVTHKGDWNKKIKPNAYETDESFQILSLYKNEKSGSFDKTQEEETASESFLSETKLEEGANFNLHESNSFLTSTSVHL